MQRMNWANGKKRGAKEKSKKKKKTEEKEEEEEEVEGGKKKTQFHISVSLKLLANRRKENLALIPSHTGVCAF